ncbi:MAG: GldM family protein [Bacteroidia bacterium]
MSSIYMSSSNLSIFVLIFVFLHMHHAEAQQTVVANTGLNVIYCGITNKLDILSADIERKNLEVYCKDFEIVDSLGYFFIVHTRKKDIHETMIKVRDKSKIDKTWTDSIYFRVKNIPRPIAILGTLPPGSYSYGQIASQYWLWAYLDEFIYSGVKYNVISYQLNVFNIENLEVINSKHSGNSTQAIRDAMRMNFTHTRIEINEIKALLSQANTVNDDTIKLLPITYSVKATPLTNLIAEFYDGNSKKIITQNSDFHKDSIYGNIRVLKQVQESDTIILAKRQDSAGHLLSFQRYHTDKSSNIKLQVKRLNDSSYYLKYFNAKGICIAEGKSYNFMYDLRSNFYDSHRTFNSKIDSIYFSLNDQWLRLFGEWKFYHNNGALLAKGNFVSQRFDKPMIDDGFIQVVCGSVIDRYEMTGIWKAYDVNGKLIEERNFDKKKN